MTDQIRGSSGAPPENRRHQRFNLPTNTRAFVRDAKGNDHPVRVNDLSGGGAGLAIETPFDNHAFIELHMVGMEPVSGKVRRKLTEGMGVEFDLSDKEKKDMEDEIRKFRLAVARENS